MGWHISAGRRRAKHASIGYAGWMFLIRNMIAAESPAALQLFNDMLTDINSWQRREKDLFPQIPEEITRLICIKDVDEIPWDMVKRQADIMDKAELIERQKGVREVFRYARRHRANIHIS